MSSSHVLRPDAQIHFGVFFQGVNHTTIWSDPASGSQIDFETFRHAVTTAERGLFDAFFLGEGLRLREQDGKILELDIAGRPDAIAQLSALAGITERVGLVATQNTTYNEPGDLARPAGGARHPLRRPGGVERRHDRQRLDGRELPARRLPRS